MIPRRKRKTLLILTIILFIVIILTILALLYIKTDIFKSSHTLFEKYIGQNIENIESLYQNIEKNEYNEMLEQNKYTEDTQIKVNFTKNIGTSLENTKNPINLLKLIINGQTDKNNKYNYQNIQLLNNNEEISKVEYIQKDDIYGIALPDMFNQYILAQNENLKELFEKAGYTQEELEKIPDKIEIDLKEIIDIFKFSEQEKQEIKNKYLGIINNNVTKENFSKKVNQTIQIDNNNINTNIYILTLTKEQMNNIYIKILEEIEQDEILLSKIENIQNIINKYKITSEEIKIKEQFHENIEKAIDNITKNNIGNDEITISVYEINQKTVKTTIESTDYMINLETLSIPTEQYIQISYKNNNEETERKFTCKKVEQEVNIEIKINQGEEEKVYNITNSEQIENMTNNKKVTIKYEDKSNKIEANILKKINIVEDIKEIDFNDKNSINLTKLENEQLKSTLEKIKEEVDKKTNEIQNTTIKMEDILEIVEATGLIKQQQLLKAMGVTEAERNRFNSKFEILQGNNLDSENIIKVIEAIKENFIEIEPVSNSELKLKLDRKNKNEELANIITNFIKQHQDTNYNVKVEYDETTGLVSDILLTMIII